MKIFYSDHFVIPLPAGHRFPIEKYVRLRDRVTEELVGGDHTLHVPAAATDRELRSVHTEEYLRKVEKGALSAAETRRMGFPWSPGLVERSRRSVGGTLASVRAALDEGVAVSLSGGTHHAFPDRGEGFCVFNDVAVAAAVVRRDNAAQRVAILDLDVHQGNGTAFVFREDPSVFTLSVHGANNFPFQKQPGDLDLELPDNADDGLFLEVVRRGVEEALERSRPDLVLYLAGADPFKGDRLGRLDVSKQGLRERDRFVFDATAQAGTPVAVVMGGGYALEIADIVDVHFATVKAAADRWSLNPASSS